MITLRAGDKAPDFIGTDQNGNIIRLSHYKGKKLVLYFYPKDNTTGCTAEACSLRDSDSALQAAGYSIVGVSPDSTKSHLNFATKHSLPFPLVADIDKTIALAYGAWGEKKLYGKTYTGILRTTFKIDENGIIEDIITKVNTKDHAAQILSKA
jgi:peroxiredoxin Q/BCP